MSLTTKVIVVVVLPADHQVRRLDVAVDELLLRGGAERAHGLDGDTQRRGHGQRAGPAHPGFDGLAVDEFHGVEKLVPVAGKVIHAGDVAVPQGGGGARLADEPGAGDFAVEKRAVDHLQRDVALEVHVKRLVGDPHGPAAQLPERAILAPPELVMLKGFGRIHAGQTVGQTAHGRGGTATFASLQGLRAAGKTNLFRRAGFRADGSAAAAPPYCFETTAAHQAITKAPVLPPRPSGAPAEQAWARSGRASARRFRPRRH